jgi:high-affinity Fe2+/Pb2+ permease
MRTAIGLAAIGFVATLVLAWYHGVHGRQKVSATEGLILAALLAVGGGMLWQAERLRAPADTRATATTPTLAAVAKPANPRSIATLERQRGAYLSIQASF